MRRSKSNEPHGIIIIIMWIAKWTRRTGDVLKWKFIMEIQLYNLSAHWKTKTTKEWKKKWKIIAESPVQNDSSRSFQISPFYQFTKIQCRSSTWASFRWKSCLMHIYFYGKVSPNCLYILVLNASNDSSQEIRNGWANNRCFKIGISMIFALPHLSPVSIRAHNHAYNRAHVEVIRMNVYCECVWCVLCVCPRFESRNKSNSQDGRIKNHGICSWENLEHTQAKSSPD